MKSTVPGISLLNYTIHPDQSARMAMKPNYRYERSQRDKAKAAKKEAKLAAKAVNEKSSLTDQDETQKAAADES